MATSELPARSGVDVGSLAQLFLGKNSSSGQTQQNSGGIGTTGTVTTSESVSPDAVNAVVKSILEGNQGLAAVSSGQKKAGMYNSSTNMMLTNDLIARAAAEGAKLNKTSTQTTNTFQADNRQVATQGTTVQAPPIKPSTAAMGLGVLSLIPKDFKQSVVSKLGLGTKAAAGGVGADTGAGGQTTGDFSRLDRASNDVVSDAINVQNPGAAQSISAGITPGIGTSLDSQSIAAMGPQTAQDMGDSFASYIGGGDSGSAVASNLSGVDTSGMGDGGGNYFDPSAAVNVNLDNIDLSGMDSFTGMEDFLGFAEGGVVKKSDENIFQRRRAAMDAAEGAADKGDDTNQAYQDRMGQQTKDSGKAKSLLQKLIPHFAEGGMVRLSTSKGDEKKSENIFQRRRAAMDAAEDAANKGDDTNDAYQKRLKGGDKDKTPGYADGGMVSKIGVSRITHDATGRKNQYADPRSTQYIPEFNDGGTAAKGYATGGMVDLTNTGLRKSGPNYESGIGVSMDSQSVSDAVAKSLLDNSPMQASGTKSANTAGLNVAAGGQSVANKSASSKSKDEGSIYTNDGGDGNAGTGVSGVGTTGSGIGVSSGVAGVAGVGMGMAGVSAPGMMGLANASTNTQAVNSVVSAIASVVASPVVGLVVNALMSGASGDNSSTVGDVAASNANAAADANGMDTMDAMMSMLGATATGQGIAVGTVDQNTGTAVGAGPGPAGVSTDGGVGVGTSSGDSVGTGDGSPGDAFKSGGKVNGPGTATSDSILARLSDGEHVTKTSSVNLFGEKFMNAVNEGDPESALVELFSRGLVK